MLHKVQINKQYKTSHSNMCDAKNLEGSGSGAGALIKGMGGRVWGDDLLN